ncbi:hypothetical protein DFH09DRAFT_1286006 [Mycena vulgaris]|nr:hypothetical protein DFH09DRAFT_1286006 [Mycena vulgaris]
MCNALQGRRHGRRGAIKASARFLLVRTVACSDALQRRRCGGRMRALRLGNTHTFLPADARSGALPGGRRRRNARKRDTRDRCRARRGTLVMGAGPDVLRRQMRPSVLGTLYNHFVLHVAGTGMLPRLAIVRMRATTRSRAARMAGDGGCGKVQHARGLVGLVDLQLHPT